MSHKKICKDYFSNQGFIFKKEDKVLKYISYKFLLFEKGTDKMAAYILRSDDAFPLVIDAAKVCNMYLPSIKIGIFIPQEFSIPGDLKQKISNSNIDIYTITDEVIDVFVSSEDLKILHKYKIDQIWDIFRSINIFSNKNHKTLLFKLDRSDFDNLKPNITSKEEFIFQISQLISIIESLEYKKIKNILGKLAKREEVVFKSNQSISALEIFFKKRGIKIDPLLSQAIIDLRLLRDLRNMPPIHKSSKYEKPCIQFLGKLPSSASDWKKLNQIILFKFEGSLIIIRNSLK